MVLKLAAALGSARSTEEHLESCTRGMLRKAIQNVMREIEYHEAETRHVRTSLLGPPSHKRRK
jgi:hypothetical protein